jgi:NAD(P)-dependent dehydrogenase (short-subunit alcohol dehydrogenase family)
MGRAHAVRLAEEGANLIIVDLARKEPGLAYSQGTPGELAETASLVEAAGRKVLAKTADVRDQAALNGVVAEATDFFGSIDILVSNAGISSQAAATDLTDGDWEKILGVNLVGAWHAAKAVIPGMIERGRGGSIVFISSVAGLQGAPHQAHYVASKHGIQGLVGALANELGPHDIRVNSVNPGTVDTEMALNEHLLRNYFPTSRTRRRTTQRRHSGRLRCCPSRGCSPRTSLTLSCGWPPTRPAPSQGSRSQSTAA